MLQGNRPFSASVAEIMQFLAVNELPMRGTYDIQEQCLFKNLFEFTNKNETLKKSSKCTPWNTIHPSPEIQINVIQILSACVRKRDILTVFAL